MTAITELEARIAELSALIARRREQSGIADFGPHGAGEGGRLGPSVGHGQPFRNTASHTAAAEKQLRDLRADLITLKIACGQWDPAAIIERMKFFDRRRPA